jgi:hypothetical protein
VFDTPLSAEEERQFRAWKAKYAPNDSGADYDLRGAFKAGLKPDPKTGHWPDTFKKPNHPTFSNESKYATGENAKKAGFWSGEIFNKPMAPPFDFNLTAQAPTLGGDGFQVQQAPTTIEALLALIGPYLASQQGQREQGMNSLVRGLQALRGGGHRDSLTGAIMNPDPLQAQKEHDAYWNALFTPTADRIAKERARFQTPSDIPTFTEQELAGINARARNRFGSPQGAGPSPAMPVTGSPAPTPYVARNPSQAPTPPTPTRGPELGGQGPSQAAPPEAPFPQGPPMAVDVSPPFMLPPNPLDVFFAHGPQIVPELNGGQYRYGTGNLGPGGQPAMPTLPNFGAPPVPPQNRLPIPPWMYGVGTLR